jgi:threonine/homoserine/homoserine lactone efflux protein
MPDCPIESEPTSSKKCKWGLIFCTAIYTLLFPFLFYMALLSAMVSDNPRITSFFVGVIMLIVLCIPLSIPISIYFMWSRYFRKQYDKARLFSWIPFYIIAAVFVLLGVAPYLYHTVLDAFTRP